MVTSGEAVSHCPFLEELYNAGMGIVDRDRKAV
jgi:hypothetical protein